jgi:hypothetical protein
VLFLGHVFPGHYGFNPAGMRYVRYLVAKLDEAPDLQRASGYFLVQLSTLKSICVINS